MYGRRTIAFALCALASIPLFAESGDITLRGVSVWRAADGPHTIAGILTVADGATLTIEAGAIVKFAPGGNSGITVNGRLVVAGTDANPVYFTSALDPASKLTPYPTSPPGVGPQPGDWSGIHLAGPAASASVSHAVIRYATDALSAGAKSALSEDHTLRLNTANRTAAPQALPRGNPKPMAYPAGQVNLMPSFTNAPAGWTTDRYDPAFFGASTARIAGRNGELQIQVNQAQGYNSRPAGYQTSFYDFQGRTYPIAGTGAGDSISADIYVPASFATAASGNIASYLWAVGYNAGAAADYAIIGFANTPGTGEFAAWDDSTSSWIGLTANTAPVQYGAWNTVTVIYTGTTFDYYVNGAKVYSMNPAYGSTSIGATILNTFNFFDPNLNYTAANYSVTWGDSQAPQAINFPSPGNVLFNAGSFTVAATANSGLAVAFSSSTPAQCSVSGTTVTLLDVGTCTLVASQAGNITIAPAPSVTQSFTITPGAQSINFVSISPNKLSFGSAPVTLSATTSSGLAVTFASTTNSVCTVSGNTLTILSAGTCTVTATQPGDAEYNAAATVSLSAVIGPAAQTITFLGIPNVSAGSGAFSIGAVATSGLAVSFTSNSTAVCTVAGSIVTPLTAGTCSITANQSGNANYTAAAPVTQTFTVTVPVTITSSTFPVGVVNQTYGATSLAATGGSGGFSWAIIAGSLPPGLSLAPTGLLSGSPTASGTFTFTVKATDSSGSSMLLPLAIQINPALAISTKAVPAGIQGVAYSANLTAINGSGNYTWTTLNSAALPPGISLSAAGLLAGTPTSAGTFTFTAQVSDGISSLSQQYSLAVGAVLSSPVSTLPSAIAGSGYSASLTASGGTGGPYTWSLLSGSLPSGLKLSANGTITGNPGVSGNFSFTLQVSDGVSPPVSVPVSLHIFTSVSVTTASLPNATSGAAYGPITLAAQGGSGTLNWSATGLPNGLSLSAAGVLSGTPAAAGTSSVNITATDPVSGQVQTLTIPLTVVAPTPALTLSPSALSVGAGINSPVTGTFTASGGVAPYKFSATGLPGGVILSATGTISGSSNAPGNYTASVTVTDSAATPAIATAQLTIRILGLTVTTLPGGAATVPYFATFTATGGTAPYVFSAANLPAGFALSGSGALTGTAGAIGTISFSVQVADASGLTSSATYSIAIHPAPITLAAPTLPAANVGTPYSQVLTGTGGVPPYSWSLLSGALPTGLSLAASGTLSGTPTAPGAYTFAVQATDASGGVASVSVTLVVAPSPITSTTTALPSGVVSFAYPQQILSASGGVAPYTFSLANGGLPPGVTLTNGVISGTPTTAGTYPFTISVRDSASNQTTFTTTIVIRAATSDLILLAAGVSFSLMTGATGLPPAQAVGVQSSVVAEPVAYTYAVSPVSPWLTVTSGGMTPGILQFTINNSALTLAPATYVATITLTCTSVSCAGKTQNVSATLTVTSPPAQLSLSTTLLSFATSTTPPQPQTQSLGIQNTGGGSLTLTSISCEAIWCSIGGFPASLTAGPTAEVAITVDPATLSPGYYRTAVDVVTSAGSASVPVSFFITGIASMNLAPAGSQFTMPAGGSPGNASGSFLVSAAGGTFNWTAAVLQAPNWLTLNNTFGTSSDAQPGSVSFAINANAAFLAPQVYYATIEVIAPNAANSPLDYQVVLNVTQNQQIAPDPEPAGLLFITTAGASPAPQIVSVYGSSAAPLNYQAAAATADGATWLTVAPAIGSTQSGLPGTSTINVSAATLGAGVYTGGISYAFSSIGVRTVNVTLIVQPQAAATGGSLRPGETVTEQTSKNTCAPTKLVPTQTGLVNNFSAPASWPTPLAVKLVDDCGNNITTGQVVATFANGDPPLALPLADPNSALYSATWTPRSASSQVTVTARATATGLASGSAQIVGAVVPNVTPTITPHGTVHPYNPQIGGALAPGTIMAIYGANMASGPAQPATTPLPTSLNGTSVLIGGIPSPLFYVSPGQINVQIPFELSSNGQYQVIVNANGALTAPAPINTTPATPGVDAFADGSLIAVHATDGSLISPSSPAQQGEYIVLFLLGMGGTDNTVASGKASPGTPLSRPTQIPTLTLAGNPVPVAFAGLSPGFVGLYQINLQIPQSLPGGNVALTVTQNNNVSNTTILPIAY